MTAPKKLTLLSLDGGCTRVIVQLFMLDEIMHRLAWDREYIREGLSEEETTKVYVCDYFDFIGAAGNGAIIAFLLATRRTVTEARAEYMRLAPYLKAHTTDLEVLLESMLSEEIMDYEGMQLIDQPVETNVWISGTCVKKGMPIKHSLLPLVLEQVRSEVAEDCPEFLNTTPAFFSSVCPNDSDCSVLVSLGSGKIPKTYSPPSFGSIWRSSSPTSPSPCSMMATSLPTQVYRRIYIRLNPQLVQGGSYGTKDWESEKFGNHKTYTLSYCESFEISQTLDRIVNVLIQRPEPVLKTAQEPCYYQGTDYTSTSPWVYSEYR